MSTGLVATPEKFQDGLVIAEVIREKDIIFLRIKEGSIRTGVYRSMEGLFLVNSLDQRNEGLFGVFAHELGDHPPEFIRRENIKDIYRIATQAEHVWGWLHGLILERNRLKSNIYRHNEFVLKNLLIKG